MQWNRKRDQTRNTTEQNKKQTSKEQQTKTKTRETLQATGGHIAHCKRKWLALTKIGMARATKKQGKSEPQQNRLAIQDLWEKKQHSTVRKPGLPPARSPEITQSKPCRDNISQICKSRLAMTPSRSQREVKRVWNRAMVWKMDAPLPLRFRSESTQ